VRQATVVPLCFVSTVTSVGVVVIGLILVRLSQKKNQDSAEQAVWNGSALLLLSSCQTDDINQNKFLGNMYNWWPVLGTELLAVIFGLPYALLMWRSATVVFGPRVKLTDYFQ
jgi:hypothetical protein